MSIELDFDIESLIPQKLEKMITKHSLFNILSYVFPMLILMLSGAILVGIIILPITNLHEISLYVSFMK